ncbi:hypothetical protein BD413DRAFT_156866 [Trametes elegans]|nr:hypothetical protein BD413DRAFT_156866 [Trametes elegans]
MLAYAALAALLAGTALVHADPTPNAPGPGDKFKVGDQCTFSWEVDTSGTWTEMNVELMTGDNWNMAHLNTVATLDGTDASKTSFSYDCPEVDPYSTIYFYQFSSPASANRTWSTRFTITDADGNSTPPANDTQPDGQKIGWGIGKLVDASKAVAAPAYLNGGASSAAASTAASATSGAASSTAAAAGTSANANNVASSQSSSKDAASSKPAAASSAPSSSATTNGTAGDSNGAISALAVDGYLVRAAVALGVAALTFGVAL